MRKNSPPPDPGGEIKNLYFSTSGESIPPSRERALRIEGCALLVVDMQDFFLDRSSHASVLDPDEVERNVKRLIDSFRGAGIPVLFTRHIHREGESLGSMGRWWRDPLMGSSRFSKLRLEPAEGEVVIEKSTYDAFHGTDAEGILKEMGVKEVVIAGVMTHLCVETTARSSFVRDLDVTVVHDACGSVSRDLHHSSLKIMAHGFAVLKSTDRIIREVSR